MNFTHHFKYENIKSEHKIGCIEYSISYIFLERQYVVLRIPMRSQNLMMRSCLQQ